MQLICAAEQRVGGQGNNVVGSLQGCPQVSEAGQCFRVTCRGIVKNTGGGGRCITTAALSVTGPSKKNVSDYLGELPDPSLLIGRIASKCQLQEGRPGLGGGKGGI